MNIKKLEDIKLLQLRNDIIEELIERGTVTTRNSPVGDYTEKLVCEKLKLKRQKNSSKGYDALKNKDRYQIKGRVAAPNRSSVQLSTIRDLKKKPFDYLICVIFERDFSIRQALKIPHKTVLKTAGKKRERVNGFNLIIKKSTHEIPGVMDITKKLK